MKARELDILDVNETKRKGQGEKDVLWVVKKL